MIGGGSDRADLKSYDPEQYLESDDPNDMMGCHVGDFLGLNIINAQPGKFYAWCDDSQKGLMRARYKSYQVVHKDDPEMAGYQRIAGYDHQDLDSASTGFPGVVLVRRSAKDEKRVRAEEQSRRDDLFRSGNSADGYLSGATAEEISQGGERFKRKEHRSFRTTGTSEDSPEVLEPWTTDRGISS